MTVVCTIKLQFAVYILILARAKANLAFARIVKIVNYDCKVQCKL
jgi:hypothetical protein